MTPEDLQRQVMRAIEAYNRRRFDVLRLAMEEDGPERVDELESEYDALRDAYFELIRTELDQNNHRYQQITDQAAATASAIEQSVATLASTAAVLNTIASTVNLLGRVLVVLGI